MGQTTSASRRILLLENPAEGNEKLSQQKGFKPTSKIDDQINANKVINNDVSGLEKEFETIYSRHSIIHISTEAPCKNVSELIINCLREHPMKIGNCMSEIDEYKKCVKEACMFKLKKL